MKTKKRQLYFEPATRISAKQQGTRKKAAAVKRPIPSTTKSSAKPRGQHPTMRTARASFALETSATRPSRKSTRKSANRAKPDSNLHRRAIRLARAPEERARKAKARPGRAV